MLEALMVVRLLPITEPTPSGKYACLRVSRPVGAGDQTVYDRHEYGHRQRPVEENAYERGHNKDGGHHQLLIGSHKTIEHTAYPARPPVVNQARPIIIIPAMRNIDVLANPEYASSNVMMPVTAIASIASIVVTERGTFGMQYSARVRASIISCQCALFPFLHYLPANSFLTKCF